MTLATFIQASAHQLTGIADGSVQAIVTSPPFYGLRKYEGDQEIEWQAVDYAPMAGLPPIHIAGCDPACKHEWSTSYLIRRTNDGGKTIKQLSNRGSNGRDIPIPRNTCAKCGGVKCGLGNEPTLEMYIGHLILCLREWRRVLRKDGVCFVNLGDSYATGTTAGRPEFSRTGIIGANRPEAQNSVGRVGTPKGLKTKDLMGVPARFVLAAQADGWWWRSDIIGNKKAPMPESVTDRPTRSHEYIFMLTKAARYYWDAEAVRETGQEWTGQAGTFARKNGKNTQYDIPGQTHNGHRAERDDRVPAGRQMRDVIEWRPQPFSAAHFATWPEAIPEKLIRAATSERGCCSACGSPWARVVERTPMVIDRSMNHPLELRTRTSGTMIAPPTAVTTGWQPTCTCPAADPVPCLVLDPFSGSGTTAKVAVRLGRRAIGVDVSAEYLGEITAQRFGDGVQMELVAP